MKARPFLKWAGGKTKLASVIASHMPERVARYHDRFCGAGGMYFHLANENRFESAVISDKNPEIVSALNSVKINASVVHELVASMTKDGVNRDDFERIKRLGFGSPGAQNAYAAARTIILNKYGFNGLYRLNRKGEFNVPYGKRHHVNIDVNDLMISGLLLRRATIEHMDALAAELDLDLVPGDVCYHDPPYIPVSKTASFTAYDGHPFTLDDQRRLAAKSALVASNGACVIISNSDTDEAREIFGRIPGVETFQLSRSGSMNSNKSKRGRVSELLFVINGRKQ